MQFVRGGASKRCARVPNQRSDRTMFLLLPKLSKYVALTADQRVAAAEVVLLSSFARLFCEFSSLEDCK